MDRGDDVVLISRGLDARDPSVRNLPGVTFAAIGTSDVKELSSAFAGCDAIAHCAGINREIGAQTFRQVHVNGTQNVVDAAKEAGVKRVALMSFLRARPACGSPYHETKRMAEEIVRASGLDYTVVKAGMIYGPGDHMLDHLSHAFYTFPVFAHVGKDHPVAPLAVEDMVRVLCAALTDPRLTNLTVAVVGPDVLTTSEVIGRVARVVGRRPLTFRLPVGVHMILALVFEWLMVIPLVARAQVRILSESVVDPLPSANKLPEDLLPRLAFTEAQIRRGLPEPGPFGFRDLRPFSSLRRSVRSA